MTLRDAKLFIACSFLSVLLSTTPLQWAHAEPQLLAQLDASADRQPLAPQRPTRDTETLLSSLGQLDLHIGQAESRIAALEADAAQDSDALAELREVIDQGRKLSESEQRDIHEHLRATWRLHSLVNRRIEHLRQAPTDWRRTQRYLSALDSHLERRRGQARLALADVMSSAHNAEKIMRALDAHRQNLQSERVNLKHLLASRQPVLLQLDAAKAQSGSQLITVYAEDDSVKQRLEIVDTALADGEMPWPVNGAVNTRFGDKRPAKGQRWQGIHIGAAAGDAVRAVGAGVVVFAGWLRGQGLLVVIDHGDGMMAVYGNNRRLLADVGDTVKAGDAIASIGATTADHATNLYFELRVEGKAVDPLEWLSLTPS